MINKPGDEYEQEADQIANQVMAAPGPTPAGNVPSRIQSWVDKAGWIHYKVLKFSGKAK